MTTVNPHILVFPVIGGELIINKKQSEPNFTCKLISGTCFSIGSNYFITAAHVLQDALEYKSISIGFFEKVKWKFSNIVDYEINTDNDVAVFNAKIPDSIAFKWSSSNAPYLGKMTQIGLQFHLVFYKIDIIKLDFTVNIYGGKR